MGPPPFGKCGDAPPYPRLLGMREDGTGRREFWIGLGEPEGEGDTGRAARRVPIAEGGRILEADAVTVGVFAARRGI